MAKHNTGRRIAFSNVKKPQSESAYIRNMISGGRGAGKTVSSTRMAAEAYHAFVSHRQGQAASQPEPLPFDEIRADGSLPQTLVEYISRIDGNRVSDTRTQDRLISRASAFSSRGNPFQSPTSQAPPPPQQGIIWTNTPDSSGGWRGNGSSSAPYIQPVTTESIKEQQPQRPEYTADETDTKFIALVTMTFVGDQVTGILFVRRCGAWKLIECKTGLRIASASAGAVLPDHTVHYYIYQEEDEQKSKRVFKRHETVGAE